MSSKQQVVIGVDPHKLSATIEVVDPAGVKLGEGRYGTETAGFAAMRDYVSTIEPERARRVWAVEGANGAGRSLAQYRATAARGRRASGRRAGQARGPGSGCSTPATRDQHRKTDAVDAHSIAMVATSSEHRDGLRVLSEDGELEAIRVLCDRRDELSKQRIQTVNRIHRLLSELVPGTRKKGLSAAQAKRILAPSVRATWPDGSAGGCAPS